MSSPSMCQRVQRRVSAWLDQRLDADSLAAIERHLERCDACRSEYVAAQELSRRVSALEVDALPEGFAASVREVAVGAGQHWPRKLGHPLAVRLAAAALVIVGLLVAYDLGRKHGHRTDGAVPVARAVAFDSPTHLRAARSVASDLGVIDRIPEKMRRPMLRAQIDHFELDTWADVARQQAESPTSIRDLATLIHGLDDILDDESRFGAELAGLRRMALRPSIWVSSDAEAFVMVDVDDAHRQDRRSRSVRLVAKHMSAGERSGLDRLLEFKEHLADGNPWPFITLGVEELEVSKDLRPAVEVMVASSLGAAGLDEMAVPWMRPLQEDSPDVFELLSTTVFDGRNPMQVKIDIGEHEFGGGGLQQRLQQLFDKTQGSGEIVIQEANKENGYSFQVFIRTESSGRKGKRK